MLSSQPRDQRGQVLQKPWAAAEVARKRARGGRGIVGSGVSVGYGTLGYAWIGVALYESVPIGGVKRQTI